MKADKQLAAWCEALASASRARQPDVVPAGWFTTRQIATARGLHKCNVERKIRALIGSGLAEVREFLIRAGNGTKSVRHYRLK
jgi:hypothetical protein